MAKYVDWSMEGVEFANCNCSWGCPCQFNGMPTNGSCRAFCFLQIEKGHFGDVPLDGLRWGILGAWPSAIHLGNGTFISVIEERANPRQRQAIEAVSHGKETEPGTLIWQVFSATVSKLLPTVYKPIELSIDYSARKARLNVPGLVEGHAESIRNPVTGAPHRCGSLCRPASNSPKARSLVGSPRPQAQSNWTLTAHMRIWRVSTGAPTEW